VDRGPQPPQVIRVDLASLASVRAPAIRAPSSDYGASPNDSPGSATRS